MEILVLLGVLIGLAGGIAVTALFFKNKKKQETEDQSVILLNKINQVCKLITVEGEFSEVFTHHDGKSVFFSLLQLKKKALLIVKAKVLIGFDFTKIKIDADPEKKLIILTYFPQPEILGLETDLEYYDVQKGIINKFSETDLTNMNKKSKEFIRDKIEQSYLFQIARDQAVDTIAIIRQLIDSADWNLVAENMPELKTADERHPPLTEFRDEK